MQLFVDMDGVIADFDQHHENVFGFRSDKLLDNVDWAAVRKIPHFYLHIPPMKDLDELWSAIVHLDPIVLTGIPYIPEASGNKQAWGQANLPEGTPMITCKSKEKYKHMIAPGDILIDDWEKHKSRWVNAGGIWITHISAKDTIEQLVNMGVLT